MQIYVGVPDNNKASIECKEIPHFPKYFNSYITQFLRGFNYPDSEYPNIFHLLAQHRKFALNKLNLANQHFLQ